MNGKRKLSNNAFTTLGALELKKRLSITSEHINSGQKLFNLKKDILSGGIPFPIDQLMAL
jgi:hypothetical protein